MFHCATAINSIIYTRASTATSAAATPAATSASTKDRIRIRWRSVIVLLFFVSEVCCCFLRPMHVRFTVEIFDQFKFFICNERNQIAPKRTQNETAKTLILYSSFKQKSRARIPKQEKEKNICMK